MKVVVFGGSGFLGSHVTAALIHQGHDVTVFDLKKVVLSDGAPKMITGDILDAEVVESALAGADVAYNFAGIADLDDASSRAAGTVTQNILGNINVLNACLAGGVGRMVYASTIYVYGPLGGFYRCSKQASELYIEEYERRHGLPYTILRYGTLYGPGATATNSIYRYLRQALVDGRIVCDGTGEETREYIYIKDAANLSARILDDQFVNKHVIITGHHPMRFSEMLAMIREMLNNKVEIEHSLTSSKGHYNITPYSFTPKIGEKLVTDSYTDMGQGLLECLHELYDQLSQEGALEPQREWVLTEDGIE